MANPQLENGYTRIANEIIDRLARFRISGNEWQILLVIFRKTYGFRKKADRISMRQFADLTGLKRSVVSRNIDLLIQRGVIKKDSSTGINSYNFNKNYDEWKVLSKKLTDVKKNWLLSKIGDKSIMGVIKKDNRVFPKKSTKVFPKKIPTKEIKETFTKERPNIKINCGLTHIGKILKSKNYG